MRNFLIPLAAAASTVAIAAPASAQWYPQNQTRIVYQQPRVVYQQPRVIYQQPRAYGYGYQQPRGYAYGHQNNFGQAQAMKQRIDRIQREIQRFAQFRMISRGEYNNRIRDSREIERRFYRHARDGRGLTQREMYDIQMRVARLEQRIARDIRDGRQWRYRW